MEGFLTKSTTIFLAAIDCIALNPIAKLTFPIPHFDQVLKVHCEQDQIFIEGSSIFTTVFFEGEERLENYAPYMNPDLL